MRQDTPRLPRRASDYRVSFRQEIHRGDETSPLVVADVQVVCVDRQGHLAELPDGILS